MLSIIQLQTEFALILLGACQKNPLLSADGAWLTALSLSYFVALIRARLSSLLLASVVLMFHQICATIRPCNAYSSVHRCSSSVESRTRGVRPHAFAPPSNDLFLSEPSAGWMETATDVRLSPEKPPIPTVTPFLAGQAQYWQDTEFQWSRTFDQSTHFWGVFACFIGVCSNLLSKTHVQKLQMGLTHVCSFYHSVIVCETVVR